MTEFKKHTDKISIKILRGEYMDYDQNWCHYDREYKMLLKAQTEAFKLANDAAEQQGKEAIDTVVAELEKPNANYSILLNKISQYRREQAELLEWNKHNGHPITVSFDEGGLNACDKIIAMLKELEKPLPTNEEHKEQGNLTCRVMLRQLNCGFTKDKVTFSLKELFHWFETGQHLKEWKEWDTF